MINLIEWVNSDLYHISIPPESLSCLIPVNLENGTTQGSQLDHLLCAMSLVDSNVYVFDFFDKVWVPEPLDLRPCIFQDEIVMDFCSMFRGVVFPSV